MVKYLLPIIFAIMILFSTTFGQDEDQKKDVAPKELILEEIIKPQTQLSKRIFFVLDVSSSMKTDGQMKRMLEFVNGVFQQPLDEFEIAIVVFNTKAFRWDGVASPKDDPKPLPKGWAKLPSKDAIDEAQKWLSTFPGDGGTDPTDALEIALKEDRSDLSIILVTDGDFNGKSEPNKAFLQTIKDAQEKREKAGLGRAVIAIFGVGPTVAKEAHLKTVGKDEKGGFFIEQGSQRKAKSDIR